MTEFDILFINLLFLNQAILDETTLEQRLVSLEHTVAELKRQMSVVPTTNNWQEKVTGSISDEQTFHPTPFTPETIERLFTTSAILKSHGAKFEKKSDSLTTAQSVDRVWDLAHKN